MEIQTIFVLTVCIGFILISYVIPNKVRLFELYATSLFATLFGLFVDMILAVKYKFYVLDKPGVQIPPLIGQVVLYFTGCYIIMNFYPYRKSKTQKISYIFICSLLAVLFEYISFRFKFIQYNEWNIWYSALCYPLIISIFVWHYYFFQKLQKHFQQN